MNPPANPPSTDRAPDIRRLYLFHFFNSIALAVVGIFLFWDKFFLRLGFNMAEFGLIKGLAAFIPMGINLVVSPLVLRLRRDREAVALAYLVRVTLPFLMLGVPYLTEDKTLRVAACAAILVATMIFPMIANNSLYVLCKRLLPADRLGKHMGWITSIWNAPCALLGIVCCRYLDGFANAPTDEFVGALFRICVATTVFQLPASWIALRLSRPQLPQDATRETGYRFRAIMDPFQDPNFRVFLSGIFMVAAMSATVASFVNPYLLQIRGLTLSQISVITAAISLAGFLFRPLWGRMADRVGGRNVLRFSLAGVGLGVFALTGQGFVFLLVFALLAWQTIEGVFGTGVYTGSQYLMLSLSDEERSNIYIAATTFIVGCGGLAGSVVGGQLLEWLKARMDPALPAGEHYRIYFLFCGLGWLITSQFVTAIRERRRRITFARLLLEVYHTVRGALSRAR